MKDKVLEALSALFADTSVPQSQTRADLEEIAVEIQNLVEALDG